MDLAPGGAAVEEGEAVAPTIITLVRHMVMEGAAATLALLVVLGVATEGEAEEVVMEHRSRAMGE